MVSPEPCALHARTGAGVLAALLLVVSAAFSVASAGDDPDTSKPGNTLVQDLKDLQETLDLLTRPVPASDGEVALPPAVFSVRAVVERGTWQIRYEMDTAFDAPPNRIVLPLDTVVDLRLTASDIIYDFTYPELGLAFEVLPGRIGSARLVGHAEGSFPARCQAPCPEAFWRTPLEIALISPEAFEAWLATIRPGTD